MSVLIIQSNSRRERNKREKLQRIEAAARALFVRKGFEATTTREIAQRAGIASGTLFLYFPDKGDLLVHLFRREIEPVLDQAFATVHPSAPIAEQMTHVLGAACDRYVAQPELTRVFLRELLFGSRPRHVEVAMGSMRLPQRLARLVTAAKERGELDASLDARQATLSFVSLYYFALIGALSGALEATRLRTQLSASMALAVEGMRPRSVRRERRRPS